MTDSDQLVAQFEASRPRLRALAYRMLGSHTEADDAVQETWLRLDRTDASRVDNLGGWLTTVIGRLCLDRLRSRRAGREEPLGEWPAAEAVIENDEHDPVHQALLAESVGAALVLVLDLLPPAERVAFVLHDVFAVPFDEIAGIVDRSPEAARQLASRARRRLRGKTATADLDFVRQRSVVDAFVAAARGGDFDALVQLLDPDVVLRPDAAALRMGSLQETRGGEAVAGILSGGAQTARLALIDSVTGLVWAPQGQVRGVIEFTVTDDKIVEIRVTGDPARIEQLDVVLLSD